MAVDHILYQGKKWYQIADNAQSVSVGGKQWLPMPKQFTDKFSGQVHTCDAVKPGAYLSLDGTTTFIEYDINNVTNVIWGGDSLLIIAVLSPRKEKAWC